MWLIQSIVQVFYPRHINVALQKCPTVKFQKEQTIETTGIVPASLWHTFIFYKPKYERILFCFITSTVLKKSNYRAMDF